MNQSAKLLLIVITQLFVTNRGICQNRDYFNITDILELQFLLENLSNSTILPLLRQSLTSESLLEEELQPSTTNVPLSTSPKNELDLSLHGTVKEDVKKEEKVGLGVVSEGNGPIRSFNSFNTFNHKLHEHGFNHNRPEFLNEPNGGNGRGTTDGKDYYYQDDRMEVLSRLPFALRTLFGLGHRQHQHNGRSPFNFLQFNPLKLLAKDVDLAFALKQRWLEVKRNFQIQERERREMLRNPEAGDFMTRLSRSMVTKVVNMYQKCTSMLESTVQARKENMARFLREPMVLSLLGTTAEQETTDPYSANPHHQGPKLGLIRYNPNRQNGFGDLENQNRGQGQAWNLGELFR